MSRRTDSLHSNVSAQVDLQIKLLSRIKLEFDIRRDLCNLPKTLEATYKQIYHDTILVAYGNEPEVAKKRLGWIMVAQRLLTPQEWVGATERATHENLSLALLLELCHNLVAIDTESNVMRYVHLSVREYLDTQADFKVPELHTMAAHACLSVLIDNPPPDSPNFGSFAEYAKMHWVDHLECSDDQYMKEDTLKLIRKFLGTPMEPAESYQRYVASLLSYHSYVPRKSLLSDAYTSLVALPQNPLFAVSYFSLGGICTELWDWSGIDVNCRNYIGDSALTVASRKGNDIMVRLLLDRCVDAVFDTLPGFHNPLEAAIQYHRHKVVETLLSYRVDIITKLCRNQNPFDLAASRGNVAVVRAVLSCKNLGITISASALLAACNNVNLRCKEMLQILLDSAESFRCSQQSVEAVTNQICDSSYGLNEPRDMYEMMTSLFQQLLDRDPELEFSTDSIAHFIICGGNKALDWLLNHNTYSFEVTEDVIIKAAHLFGVRVMIPSHCCSLATLIERSSRELLENTLQRADINETLVSVILDRYPDMKPSKSVLLTLAAESGFSKPRGRLISILDKYPDMEMSQDVLIAVAKAGDTVLEKLLDNYPDMEISQDVLLKAAGGEGSDLENLLDKHPDMEISHDVLIVAAEGEGSALKKLLEKYPDMEISQDALKAAARAEGYGLELLLAREKSIVSESVLEEAAEYGGLSNVKMILEREPHLEPTDQVLEAAARNFGSQEKTDAVEIMNILLIHNDKLQISDRVLKAALSSDDDSYDKNTNEKMKFLLSKPGIVISESFLLAAMGSRLFANPTQVLRLHLAGNFDVSFVTSEAVLVAAANNPHDPLGLLELLLSSALDAKDVVKEKEAEAPLETQHGYQVLLPKDRKVCITEKVLIAAANHHPKEVEVFELLLRYDPEIQITGAVAGRVMYCTWNVRRLLLSKFREKLTQEALENLCVHIHNY